MKLLKIATAMLLAALVSCADPAATANTYDTTIKGVGVGAMSGYLYSQANPTATTPTSNGLSPTTKNTIIGGVIGGFAGGAVDWLRHKNAQKAAATMAAKGPIAIGAPFTASRGYQPNEFISPYAPYTRVIVDNPRPRKPITDPINGKVFLLP